MLEKVRNGALLATSASNRPYCLQGRSGEQAYISVGMYG